VNTELNWQLSISAFVQGSSQTLTSRHKCTDSKGILPSTFQVMPQVFIATIIFCEDIIHVCLFEAVLCSFLQPVKVSRQFLDRQFLDWVRNRVRVRVRVRVTVAVQELTVQELSCNRL